MIPDGENQAHPFLSAAILSSSILIIDDEKSPEEIYLALKKLDIALGLQNSKFSLRHQDKTVFLIDTAIFTQIIGSQEGSKQCSTYESRLEQFKAGFIFDLITYGGFKEDKVTALKTKQPTKDDPAELKALQTLAKAVGFNPNEEEKAMSPASKPVIDA